MRLNLALGFLIVKLNVNEIVREEKMHINVADVS